MLSFFKALANESGLKIVGVLASREASVGELAGLLGLKDPTVSHHLARLRDLGLVASRDDGTVRYYRLVPDALEGMAKRVLSPDAADVMAAPVDEDRFTEKVMRTFVEDGKITQIPATRKKLDVLLTWLSKKCERGRPDTEREVNALLLQHHWDSATLRRELVDGPWMRRECGIYERLI
jgi:DNA-binding transcriptional ArsR family regulator